MSDYLYIKFLFLVTGKSKKAKRYCCAVEVFLFNIIQFRQK